MGNPGSSLGNFFRELRRRKVFQVAVVYAVVGWLIIQVVETIFPRLHLPDWSITLVIVFVIIGFPIALIVAWALELTPEGVKRTEALDLFVKPVGQALIFQFSRSSLQASPRAAGLLCRSP